MQLFWDLVPLLMYLVTVLFLPIRKKNPIKYAQGSLRTATVRSALCFWDCHNKLEHSQGLRSIIMVEMFYNDLAKCLCSSCAASLPESFSSPVTHQSAFRIFAYF